MSSILRNISSSNSDGTIQQPIATYDAYSSIPVAETGDTKITGGGWDVLNYVGGDSASTAVSDMASSLAGAGSSIVDGAITVGTALKDTPKFMKDNWPDVAGLAVGIAAGFTPLDPFMDVLDAISMTLDIVDPRNFGKAMERDGANEFTKEIYDSITGQRMEMIKDAFTAKTGVKLPDDTCSTCTKAQKEAFDAILAQYDTTSRYWNIERLGSSDMTFTPPGKDYSLTLESCKFFDYAGLSKNPIKFNNMNYYLNKAQCPQDYVEAYEEYYQNNHPDTQIQDCQSSDGFLDTDTYIKQLDCKSVINALRNPLRLNYMKDLTKEERKKLTENQLKIWDDNNCKLFDLSFTDADGPQLTYSFDPIKTFSECTPNTGPGGDGKWYKVRSRSLLVPEKNGGKPCDNMIEKILCPALDCSQSDWVHDEWDQVNNTGTQKPGFSEYMQTAWCMRNAEARDNTQDIWFDETKFNAFLEQNKVCTTPDYTTGEVKCSYSLPQVGPGSLNATGVFNWISMNCDTKRNGEYFRSQYKKWFTGPLNGGKECSTGYMEEKAISSDCLLGDKKPYYPGFSGTNKPTDPCNPGSILCNVWNNEKDMGQRPYCWDSNHHYEYPEIILNRPDNYRKIENMEINCSKAGNCLTVGTTNTSLNCGNNCDLDPKCKGFMMDQNGKCTLISNTDDLIEKSGSTIWKQLTKLTAPKMTGSDGKMYDQAPCYANMTLSEKDRKIQEDELELLRRMQYCAENNYNWFEYYEKPKISDKKYNGKECESMYEEKLCPSIDCTLGEWKEWSSCYELDPNDKSKGFERQRTRDFVQKEKYGGMCDFEDSDLIQKEKCSPIDCKLSDWSDWSDCFIDSNNIWVKSRSREILNDDENGGKACSSNTSDYYEVKSCTKGEISNVYNKKCTEDLLQKSQDDLIKLSDTEYDSIIDKLSKAKLELYKDQYKSTENAREKLTNDLIEYTTIKTDYTNQINTLNIRLNDKNKKLDELATKRQEMLNNSNGNIDVSIIDNDIANLNKDIDAVITQLNNYNTLMNNLKEPFRYSTQKASSEIMDTVNTRIPSFNIPTLDEINNEYELQIKCGPKSNCSLYKQEELEKKGVYDTDFNGYSLYRKNSSIENRNIIKEARRLECLDEEKNNSLTDAQKEEISEDNKCKLEFYKKQNNYDIYKEYRETKTNLNNLTKDNNELYDQIKNKQETIKDLTEYKKSIVESLKKISEDLINIDLVKTKLKSYSLTGIFKDKLISLNNNQDSVKTKLLKRQSKTIKTQTDIDKQISELNSNKLEQTYKKSMEEQKKLEDKLKTLESEILEKQNSCSKYNLKDILNMESFRYRRDEEMQKQIINVESKQIGKTIDCSVSDWSKWSQCAQLDPNGPYQRIRTRNVIDYPQFGGKACPDLQELENCASQDCEVSDWTETTCFPEEFLTNANLGISQQQVADNLVGGAGSKWVKARTREITKRPSNGGKDCPPLSDTVSCNSQDCQVSDWSEWSGCYKDDQGKYVNTRTRTVTKIPSNGGADCPQLIDTVECKAVKAEFEELPISEPFIDEDGNVVRVAMKKVISVPKYSEEVINESDLISKIKVNPINCEVSNWTEWSDCYENPDALGTYRQTRTREITTIPQLNGKECPELIEHQNCESKDCQVSDWTEWSGCYEDDNKKYVKTRTRVATSPPILGGKDCPELINTVGCDAVDCEVSEWSEWSGCYKTDNDTYENMRYRTVTQYPMNGGAECPLLVENQSCETKNCEVSEWTQWTDCYIKDDGNQYRYRKRDVTEFPINGGKGCPELEQEELCDRQDCLVSEWSDWSGCYEKDVNNFVQTRGRNVTRLNRNGGSKCPELTEDKKCDAIDCEVNEWSEWTGCYEDPETKKIQQTRIREVTKIPQYGGVECPQLIEYKSCGPQDCEVSEWKEWSPCFQNPETNAVIQRRIREVVNVPQFGGAECPTMVEDRPCAKTDCEVSDWGEWSGCYYDEKSGKYLNTRIKEIKNFPSGGGIECPPSSEMMETIECTSKDCDVSDWSEWTGCYPIGGNKYEQMRIRTVNSTPVNGGKSCPPEEELEEHKSCESKDCKVSEWSDWTECYITQTGPKRTRTRIITDFPENGGVDCPQESDMIQTEDCQSIDCQVSEWSDWTDCYLKEGNPYRSRYRTVTQFPVLGGRECPQESDMIQTEACVSQNCEVSEWSDWSGCVQDPETGKVYEQRIKTIVKAPQLGGKSCPPEEELIDKRSCEVLDCEVSEWSDWSGCYLDSDGKTKNTRIRTITQFPSLEGKQCPQESDMIESKECEVVDCKMTEWSDWSGCYYDNGEYRQTRTRDIDTNPTPTGKPCPADFFEHRTCPPVDCEVSDWSEYTECYQNGNSYIKSQFREVTQIPLYGGKDCPQELQRSDDCIAKDCEVSDWSDWTDCYTDESNNWVQSRYKFINGFPINGGKECPSDEQLVQKQSCVKTQDCKVSDWSDWTECLDMKLDGTSDGTWRKFRTRDVTQVALFGGKECPETQDEMICQPQDCKLSDWSQWSDCYIADDGKRYKARVRYEISSESNGGAPCGEMIEEIEC